MPKPTPGAKRPPPPPPHELLNRKPVEGAPMLPTVGRIVHVHNRSGSYSPGQPEPAIVCAVNTTGLVVAGFDANGDPFKAQPAFVGDAHQPGKRPATLHACWPPQV